MDLKRCKTQIRSITTKKYRESAKGVDRLYHNHDTERADWILQFPRHILYDILSWLPMETLMSCRCVCKIFQEIIADPYFAELHGIKAHKLDHSLISQTTSGPCKFSLAYISDIEEFLNSEDRRAYPWRYLTMPSLVSSAKQPFFSFLAGSCNGLLCLFYTTKDGTFSYVCNPFLGEFMHLPNNESKKFRAGSFGFCPKTKKYKVIRFVTTVHCEIHTLGTNCWRRIENAPYPDNHVSMDSSLNGNLHWITTNSLTSSMKKENMICSLSLETEKFCYISPPSHFNRNFIRRIYCKTTRVGVLNGLFCLFYLLDRVQLEVCVMKEYGVAASWTKKFTFNLRFDFLHKPVHISPRRILNNGDLVVYYDCRPVYYSHRKGIFRELMAQDYKIYHIICHAPSFISLKNLAGGNHVEVIRRKGSAAEIKNSPKRA